MPKMCGRNHRKKEINSNNDNIEYKSRQKEGKNEIIMK